jgi:chemotaxis protein MotD
VLEIQLHPATLGVITITMRLSGSGLKISFAASSRDSAQILQEQRAELTELIRRAGYGSPEVTVELAASTENSGDEGSSPGHSRDDEAKARNGEDDASRRTSTAPDVTDSGYPAKFFSA